MLEMAARAGIYAGELRRELALRNRLWARGRAHVESYGNPPVIVYAPEHPTDEDPSLHPKEQKRLLGGPRVGTPADHPTDEDLSVGTPAEVGRHGNFFDASYAAIQGRPEWMRRFDKIHAQGRALPKAERRWRELDSSMSSDALLMNVFCAPGVAEAAAVRRTLGVDGEDAPVFGWKARVPLASGRFDRTEVDMRWAGLLVEAKLTEGDFQTRAARIVTGYRDFDAVFERELLPRVELRTTRRRTAVEFPEDYSQEFEDLGEGGEMIPSGAKAHPFSGELTYGLKPVPFTVADASLERAALEFQAGIVARAREGEPVEAGYAGYQLIRNVLAAYAEGCSFCVVHDERRPDLREAWFAVMAAVKSAEMRTRLKVLTWQELAALLPEGLQEFLDQKYGIVGAGRVASGV